jgi:hypothetical protein
MTKQFLIEKMCIRLAFRWDAWQKFRKDRKEFLGFIILKLLTKNKKCGVMWSKVDIFFLI